MPSGQHLLLIEHDADEFLGRAGGVAVVAYVALNEGGDGMVASHHAVFTREPMGAALTEDDVARHNELGVALFRAEAFSGALFGAVGDTLGGVRGMAGLLEGEGRGAVGE